MKHNERYVGLSSISDIKLEMSSLLRHNMISLFCPTKLKTRNEKVQQRPARGEKGKGPRRDNDTQVRLSPRLLFATYFVLGQSFSWADVCSQFNCVSYT